MLAKDVRFKIEKMFQAQGEVKVQHVGNQLSVSPFDSDHE